ncbi:hypothetical protein [Celerinatantimonas yamalensis]|uniref:Uncharacterized protein n=1 Tax=Celerinatantimonas yamalensis TaxID=559956 RepID=A0ABW9GA48_9GAMM
MQIALFDTPLADVERYHPCLESEPWHLQLAADVSQFLLSDNLGNQLEAQLDFQINQQDVPQESLCWHSRHHQTHQEIWSYSQSRELSVGITYRITPSELTIDYLVRHQTPAHIKLCHRLNAHKRPLAATPFQLASNAYHLQTKSSLLSRIPMSLHLSDNLVATLTISLF